MLPPDLALLAAYFACIFRFSCSGKGISYGVSPSRLRLLPIPSCEVTRARDGVFGHSLDEQSTSNGISRDRPGRSRPCQASAIRRESLHQISAFAYSGIFPPAAADSPLDSLIKGRYISTRSRSRKTVSRLTTLPDTPSLLMKWSICKQAPYSRKLYGLLRRGLIGVRLATA